VAVHAPHDAMLRVAPQVSMTVSAPHACRASLQSWASVGQVLPASATGRAGSASQVWLAEQRWPATQTSHARPSAPHAKGWLPGRQSPP